MLMVASETRSYWHQIKSEQQARNLEKQQQDIKLRQKQLQVRTARERVNKLAAQQTQIAQQRI